MPEHLKALIFVLVLSWPTFLLARKFISADAIAPEDFARRSNLWIVVVIAGFVAHNYWIYVACTAVIMVLANGRERNKLALFMFMLFAMPMIGKEVPTFGVVQTLFIMNYPRVLCLVILLPAFFSTLAAPDKVPFGKLLIDKFFICYFVLQIAFVAIWGASLTVTMRESFYLFIEMVLPYYVASRSLRSLRAFKDVLTSMTIAIAVMAPVAMFEFARKWLLYYELENILAGEYLLRDGVYMQRGEGLRAVVTAGHAIAFGFMMMIGLSFYAFVSTYIKHRGMRMLGWLGLIGGLFASISRGPWVGAVAGAVMMILTGPRAFGRMAKLSLAGLVAIPIALVSPWSDSFLKYLPFVGKYDGGSVDYRQRLIDVSLSVLAQNPMFGVYDYMSDPRMEQMRQGQGIIDMTNTYLGVAMSFGVVGLTIFVGIFASSVGSLWFATRRVNPHDAELKLLGRCLLATLAGIVVTIATVAPIYSIPLVYWLVIGLSAGYLGLAAGRVGAPTPNTAAATPPHLRPGMRHWNRPTNVRG